LSSTTKAFGCDSGEGFSKALESPITMVSFCGGVLPIILLTLIFHHVSQLQMGSMGGDITSAMLA